MSDRLETIGLPARAERLDAMRRLIGTPSASAEVIPRRLWEILGARYDEIVTPFLDRAWPRMGATADGRHFRSKSRFIARRYASLSYLPAALELASPLRRLPLAAPLERITLGPTLRVGEPLVVAAGAAVIPAFLAAAPIDVRLSVLLGTFLTALDQAHDHGMDELDPAARHEHLEGLFLRPERPPPRPESEAVAFARALLVEIKASVPAAYRDRYEELIRAWCTVSEAEMRNAMGVADPDGLAHRRAACEATIDWMIMQSDPGVDPVIRRWMHDLAVFTQLTDDWVDAETDVRVRETSVLTGKVRLPDLERRWDRLLEDGVGMVRSYGIAERRAGELVRDSIRFVLRSGLEAMASRIAD